MDEMKGKLPKAVITTCWRNDIINGV